MMKKNPTGKSDLRYALGKVISLGSSSEGNAYYIEINRKGYPTPYKLLIECGFSYQELSKRLLRNGISIRDIDGFLVTHEHHDHSLAVPKLIEYGRNVFAPQSVFEHYGILDMVSSKNIVTAGKLKRIADEIDIYGFELEHKNDDGSKTYNLGYIIKAVCDHRTQNILFVTDTQYIRYDLSKWKFHTIFLEANNFARNIIFSMKEAHEKGETFKEMHFDRVLHSHMLVENTIKTLTGTEKRNGFDLRDTDSIYLIHMSASNSVNPYEIRTKVHEKLAEHKCIRTIEHNGKKYISPKIHVFKKNGEII